MIFFGFLIWLLPLVIAVLVLLHIIRTLDAIRTDVRRIADRLDTPQRTQSGE